MDEIVRWASEDRAESLDVETAVEEAWAAEIERRVEDYRAGKLATVPGDEVLAEARARLKQR
jgi:putative addiction module component (TIGR02574 family)